MVARSDVRLTPYGKLLRTLKPFAKGGTLFRNPKLGLPIEAKASLGWKCSVLTEAGEFTAAVLRKLCAVAARKAGKPLPDVLSLPIVAGVEFLERYATSDPDKWKPAAKQEQSEGNGRPARRRPPSGIRGRRADTDPKADKKVADAWATHRYRTYKDLGEFDMTEHQVKTALDRHRHRVK